MSVASSDKLVIIAFHNVFGRAPRPAIDLRHRFYSWHKYDAKPSMIR